MIQIIWLGPAARRLGEFAVYGPRLLFRGTLEECIAARAAMR